MKQQAESLRNDDEIFENKRRRDNIKHFRQTIDKTIDRIINLLFFLQNFFFSFIHQFLIMIRSNFELDSFQSSSRRILDQFDKLVNDILDELNEQMKDKKKEIYVIKIKRRQSVSTFDNDVKVNDNDATFSLNVIIINQLQWWVQNHSHIFLFDFNTLRIDRNRFLKALNDYHDFAKKFKTQRSRLINIETIYDEMKNKLKIVEFKVITIEIQNINNTKKIDDKRIEIIDFNTQFIELKKKYFDLIVNEERDDDDLSIVNFSKKKNAFSSISNHSLSLMKWISTDVFESSKYMTKWRSITIIMTSLCLKSLSW